MLFQISLRHLGSSGGRLCGAILHCCDRDLSTATLHAGLRTRNLDVKALQAVFELLQAHYPERLHALWFLNAPFIFWGVWRMVRLSGHPYVVAIEHCGTLHER